jgi:hypothetical protein
MVGNKVFALCALVWACGSSSSASPSGSPSQCKAACERLASCNVGNDVCAACDLWTDRWRPEFSQAYFGCLLDSATPCTSSGTEACFGKAASGLPMRPADGAYTMSCRTKLGDCPGAFIDDYCASTMLSDAWLSQANACLGKACADAGACLRAIYKP